MSQTSKSGPANPEKPPSARKLAAARANGALARGRKTLQGIARSSQNSLTHGLTAATVVLSTEDAAQYADLRAAYVSVLQPRNTVEADLLDAVVAAQWRKRRSVAMESATYDLHLYDQREEVEKEFTEISPDVRTALAFRRDLESNGSLALLSRYEGRFSRDYIGSLRVLADLLSRPLAPAAASLPASLSDPEPAHALDSQSGEQNDANPISGQAAQTCRFVKRAAEKTAPCGSTAQSFIWPATTS